MSEEKSTTAMKDDGPVLCALLEETKRAAREADAAGLAKALAGLSALGANRLAKETPSARTLLLDAAENGHSEIVALLVDWEDPEERDVVGNTALMQAARGGHLESVKILAQKSDMNARNREGYSAAHVAAMKDFLAGLEHLASLGPLPVSNPYKETVLHVAAAYSSVKCARFLLGRSDVSARNIFNDTALTLAMEEDCLEVVQLLLPLTHELGAGRGAPKEETISAALFATTAAAPRCLAFFLPEFNWEDTVEGISIWAMALSRSGAKKEKAQCLALLQAEAPVKAARAAIQKYGATNLPALFARIEAFDLKQSMETGTGLSAKMEASTPNGPERERSENDEAKSPRRRL